MRTETDIAESEAALLIAESPRDYSLWARIMAAMLIVFGNANNDSWGYASNGAVAIGGDLI